MKIYPIDLTLTDDLVLSRKGATAGAHDSLDRIPGSALLGWAAGRLYAELGQEAWLVFHSGAVRFGDGLPVSAAGQRCNPVPLSWHDNKANALVRSHQDGYWQGKAIYNLAAPDVAKPEVFQPRGLRDGFVAPDGERVLPERRYRMMTAIAEDGRVAQGQLFGYESLVRGQRFQARLSVDDHVPSEVVSRLLAVFNGTLRLGRSKSAQYGRVKASVGGALPAAPVPNVKGDEVQLLLQSDLCLRDENGQPTLTPTGEAVGLPGAVLQLDRSFMRVRRYSPWNGHRASHEMERQVLMAGSVLTFSRSGGFSTEELAKLAQGVGIHKAAGLGEVLVAPAYLQAAQPQFEKPTVAESVVKQVARPDTVLMRYLVRRQGAVQHVGASQQFVAQQLQRLKAQWRAVRSYHGLSEQEPVGPGASQWGFLAELAMQCDSVAQIQARLVGASGIVTARTESAETRMWTWAAPQIKSDNERVMYTFVDWLIEALAQLASDGSFVSDSDKLDAWVRLCNEVRKQNLHKNQQNVKEVA